MRNRVYNKIELEMKRLKQERMEKVEGNGIKSVLEVLSGEGRCGV